MKTRVRPRDRSTMLLFVIFRLVTLIGVPWFAYHYDFHTIDWVMFLVLYMVIGLGITIGYHRLLFHRSFECPIRSRPVC
jgi:stearoyl-CoA desaturase (delta-9 desaturase)